jgi:hypothetical protein
VKENKSNHHEFPTDSGVSSLLKKIVFNETFVYVVIFAVGCAYLGGAFEPKPVPQDKVKIVDYNGSIETEVSVKHLDRESDLLTTTHKVWAHGALTHTYITTDTLPSLGYMSTAAEDAQGNTQNVNVPQDYEIYITVK